MTGLLAALCGLGAWDDRHAVPVMPRLTAFFLISALSTACYWPLTNLSLWWLPIVVLALAWQLNLYNFMDGIDGIAALQCVLVAGGLALLSVLVGGPIAYSLVAVTVAGAYAGFLVFNWPPAKLFMGDAGSLSAGLLLAWLGLWLWRDGVLPVWVWLLLMSPFLVDTAATLLARMRRRERLTEAHKSHLYQRLARYYGSHGRVDLALLLLHLLWLLPLSCAVALELLAGWTSMLLGLFPQLLLMVKFRRLQ
jgi:Fuc2NAc and GlcNAc transferase